MKKAVKWNSLALLLALALSVLASCAPTGTEQEEPTKQPEPPNALETETSDSPETQTAPVETAELVRFDSKLGCSLTYDPIFFEAEDIEDEYLKSQSIESITCLSVQSVWENSGFPICIYVTPLDASSVEEAVSAMLGQRNLDGPGEETTFGSGNYAETYLTYNKVYAIGEIYITEQNGIVFEVEVSSYHRPPERQLALAYAVLDSLTF